MTWQCSQCFEKICNSRLWCPRCQVRIQNEDRKFVDAYACIIWIHPRYNQAEIYDILGPLDENLTWIYYSVVDDDITAWDVKITKWGEIIEGRGREDMRLWFDEIDNNCDIYQTELQIYRENIQEQP